MKIFNKEIFGPDADYVISLSCADKKKWIKENTNQKDDTLIDERIKSLCKDKDGECHGCKDKKNGNTAKGHDTKAGKPDPAGDTANGSRRSAPAGTKAETHKV